MKTRQELQTKPGIDPCTDTAAILILPPGHPIVLTEIYLIILL